MYLVISTWEALPGREADLARAGLQVGAALRRQPGVLFLETIVLKGRHVTAHGYADEATYRRLVHDPGSAFARALQDHGLENHGRLVSSEAGETVDYDAAAAAAA